MTQVDPTNGFIVETDLDGTSPNIQRSCWKGAHRTIDPTNWLNHDISTERAGNGIIKHQLAGNRGHYSSLCFGFVKLEIIGFPHAIHDQFVRHRDSAFNDMAFLVATNRLDNNLFIEVAEGKKEIEEVFYHRPIGEYTSRDGSKFIVRKCDRERFFEDALKKCETYRYLVVDQGWSGEVARDTLLYGFRQNFTMAGTLEAFWHCLDQRSKKNAQLEALWLADMIDLELGLLVPELQKWYRDHRFGKALLAP